MWRGIDIINWLFLFFWEVVDSLFFIKLVSCFIMVSFKFVLLNFLFVDLLVWVNGLKICFSCVFVMLILEFWIFIIKLSFLLVLLILLLNLMVIFFCLVNFIVLFLIFIRICVICSGLLMIWGGKFGVMFSCIERFFFLVWRVIIVMRLLNSEWREKFIFLIFSLLVLIFEKLRILLIIFISIWLE